MLVIDDEAPIVSLLGDVLRPVGYNVIQAVGAEQALRAIEGAEIHLVIAELNLIGIQAIRRAVRAPFLWLSEYADGESCAANVLGKPFQIAELHRKVAQALTARSSGPNVD